MQSPLVSCYVRVCLSASSGSKDVIRVSVLFVYRKRWCSPFADHHRPGMGRFFMSSVYECDSYTTLIQLIWWVQACIFEPHLRICQKYLVGNTFFVSGFKVTNFLSYIGLDIWPHYADRTCVDC